MGNVTVNIKNCGCCPDDTGFGSGGQSDAPFNELGDPESASGPPEGYDYPTGTLSDRQCKMAIWLYSWLLESVDMLGNTSQGWAILTALKTVGASLLLSSITPYIVAGITFVFSLIITPGLDPGDAVLTAIGYSIAYGLIASVAAIKTEHLSQPLFVEALPKIQNAQNNLICQLSTATNAQQAQQRFSATLSTLTLTIEQQVIIKAFMPNMLFTMMFFTAEWWPSFDDDVLTDITSTCCGDYVDGDPVTPESVQHCQASYWIINQLADIFNAAAEILNTVYTDINPFYNDKSDIYNTLHADFEMSDKAKERMTSYPAFINALTEIFYSQTVIGTALIIDPGFAGLASYIETNAATLTAGLRAEDNETDAFTYLYSTLVIWIDANVTNTQYATWVKQALAATITPQLGDNFLSLLYSQDADLIGYAGAECGGVMQTWEFDADAEGWVFTVFSGTSNGVWSADEGGSLEMEFPSGSIGRGYWSLDVLAEGWVATENTMLTAQLKGTTCASGDYIILTYSDDTQDQATITNGVDVYLSVSASVGNIGKTIKSVRVDTLKGSACNGFTLYRHIQDVMLVV